MKDGLHCLAEALPPLVPRNEMRLPSTLPSQPESLRDMWDGDEERLSMVHHFSFERRSRPEELR
jgi:hypothetical protein